MKKLLFLFLLCANVACSQIPNISNTSYYGNNSYYNLFSLRGVVRTTITSQQNNFNPSGMSTANTLRITSTGTQSITGMANGSAERIYVLHNVGSGTIRLISQSSASTAANRFALSSDTVNITPNGVMIAKYDSLASRWNVMSGGTGSGGSVSAPANEIVYGTGSGVTSSPDFTFGDGAMSERQLFIYDPIFTDTVFRVGEINWWGSAFLGIQLGGGGSNLHGLRINEIGYGFPSAVPLVRQGRILGIDTANTSGDAILQWMDIKSPINFDYANHWYYIDTTTSVTGLATKAYVLANAGGSGTVTSVATGLGLSGGTITTSGTIIADTTVLASKSFAQTLTNKTISGASNTITNLDTSSITNFGLKTRTLFSANSPSTYNNVTGKIGTDTSVVATKYYVDQSPTSCTPYISVRDSIHGCGSGLFINDSNGIGIISPAFTINSAIINNNILNGYFQLYSTNYGDGLFNVNASIGQVIIGDGAADVNNTNIVVTDVIKDVEITADSILLHNAVQPIVAADGVTQDVVITSTGKLAQKNSIERIEWYSVGADSTHIQIAGTSDSGLYRVNAYLNTQDMDAAAGNVDLYIDWVDPNGISQELFIQECVLSQQNFNSVLYPYPIVIKKNGSGNIEIKTEIIIAGYGSATYNLTIVTEKL